MTFSSMLETQRVLSKLIKFVPNFLYRNNIATGNSTSQIKAARGSHCMYRKRTSGVYLCQKGKKQRKYYNKFIWDLFRLFSELDYTVVSTTEIQTIPSLISIKVKNILAVTNLLKKKIWKTIMPSSHYNLIPTRRFLVMQYKY